MAAKAPMIEAMNGLVYEHPEPIIFSLDSKSRKDKANTFIDWVYRDLGEDIGEFFSVNQDGFFDNKTVHDYEYWDTVNKEEVVIPAGMKIGKAIIRYFQSIYGLEAIEEVRNEMSRIIQEDKVTGKLCISVHPLDFLSSSENNYNWRSCHALDGEYRAGNLSYMCDECTVVVYLKGDKPDCKLPRFPASVPWNDKKWRCLYHFDLKRQIVWAGRQYPFVTPAAYDLVNDLLFKKVNYFKNDYLDRSYGIYWCDNVFKDEVEINQHMVFLKEPYVFYGEAIVPLRKLVISHEKSMAFNDVTNSSIYKPCFLAYGRRSTSFILSAPPLVIGAPAPCIYCGGDDLTYSENMMCKECILNSEIDMEEVTECAVCGCRTFRDYDYIYGDDYLCRHCYENCILRCHHCGELFLSEDTNQVEDENGHISCDRCRNLSSAERTSWREHLNIAVTDGINSLLSGIF